MSRILFIDIDGTILAHGDQIAPSTPAVIRAAREAGHLVFICTGRADGDIHPRVREIGFDGAITNGGSLAVVGTEEILAERMPRAAVDHLTTYFDDRSIPYLLQTDDAVFASPGVNELREKWAAWVRSQGGAEGPERAALEPLPPITDVDRDTVAKAVFVSAEQETLPQAQSDLADSFHVVPGSLPLPGGSSGEIGLPGITKGSAITAVLNHLGRSAADAVGIGDSWNDVEMFEVCGVSIAMGNAEPELRTRADYVTTDVLDDGVANALRWLSLV